MSSVVVIMGLVLAFFVGYIFGFVAGSAAGKVEALEREHASDEQGGGKA